MNVNGRKAILLQKLPYEMIKAAFETYHTDMTDNGYIAVLEGTEKKEELEEGIVGGGQHNHSKGGEKRPILGKLRNQQLSLLNLFSNRFA